MKMNSNYSKLQGDKGHLVDRLYVHWDVSTQCQLKCDYCYAIKQYEPNGEWGKLDSWARQKLIIYALSRSKLPVFLGFQGGEPTIHPRFFELLELSWNAIEKHDASRLYVTTNSLQTVEFFQNYPRIEHFKNSIKPNGHPKLLFLWSVHFDYIEKYKDFIKKVLIIQEKGYRSKVNVMLHPNPEHWPFIHKIINELMKHDVEMHPHFLYDDGDMHKIHNYTPEFYKEFSYLKEEKLFDSKILYWDKNKTEEANFYTDYEFYNKDLAHFNGWDCFNNNYEINYKGFVQQFCFNISADLTKNFRFFENITEIKPKVCPHNGCYCDGLLKIKKGLK